MATTRQEREAILLQKRGLDPAQWSIGPGGALVPKTPPPVEPVPEPPREIGPIETSLRSAAGAIPETLGGAFGGGLGVMGGTAAAPLAGPLAPAAPFAGGLAGAIGGSMAAGALEEELVNRTGLGKKFREFTSGGSKENPIAAEIGNVLPQALLSNPLKSLKLARDLLRATPTLTRFTPAQISQAANLGVSTGVGVGGAVAEDAMGEGVGLNTIPKALIRGGAGLLGAEPNTFGRAMSLGTWKPTPETPDNWKGAAPVARDANQQSNRRRFDVNEDDLANARDISSKPPIDADMAPAGTVQIGDQAATDAAFAQNAPKLLGAGTPPPLVDDALLNQASELVKSGQRISVALLQRRLNIGYERAMALFKKLEESGLGPGSTQNVPPAETPATPQMRPPAVEPQYAREAVEGEQLGPENFQPEDPNFVIPSMLKRLPEPPYQAPAAETLNDKNIKRRRAEAKRAGFPQPERLQEGGKLGDTTDEWDKLISDVASRTYKSDVESGIPNLRDSNKNRVYGSVPNLPSDLERGLVKISTDAGIDTGPHELLHVILNDVLERGTPGEKRFAQKVIAAGGGEEALVQGGGQEFTRRLIDEAGGQNPSLLKDLASFVKARFGAANKKDLERLAANTLRRGAGSEQYRPNAPTSAPKVPPVQPTEGENRSKKPNERTQALSESPVPESNDTIQKQLELTADPASTKAVTLLVPGSGDVPVGDGLQRVKVPQGEAVYNPAKISEADVVKGGAGEQYDGRLLGMSQSVKPAAGDQVVTATKDDVGDVVTEAVAPGNESVAIESVSKAVPGGEIEVKPAAEIVNERTQPIGPREVYDPKEKPQRRLDPFKSSIRRLETSKDLRRQETADIFRRVFSRRDTEKGRYSSVLREIDSAPKEAADEAYRAMIERDRTGKPPAPLSTREAQALYDAMDSTYRQMRLDQNAAGHLVGSRVGKIDPTGMFNVISPDAIKLLTTIDQSSPTWVAMRDDFIRMQLGRGFTLNEAADAFNRYLNDISSEMSASKAVDFGAVSLPEGMKLPDGWIDSDPFRAWRRYIDRFAKARAWHDVVLKDPRAADMFTGDSSLARDPDVVAAFSDYTEKPPSGRLAGVSSVGRFVNMLRLGPVTRAIDMATTPLKAMAYTPASNWPAMISELSNWQQHYEDSFKTGFNRPGGDLVSHDILGAHDAAANIIDKGTTLGTKVQGLEKLEVLSRTAAQAFGAQAGGVLRSQARGGDKRAAEFLNKLGTDWNTISAEELGTRIGRLMQGTYDARGLPAWMKDSQLAPFVPLARWSTEQWNNFRQFGVEPAMKGDAVPLLRMIFAGVLGSMSVGEVRELLNNKKPYIAEIEELKNAPDGSRAFQEALLKLATAAQTTAMFGIVGDLAVQLGRLSTGKFASGFNAPAMEFTSDVAVRSIKALQAMASGVPVADVLSQYVTDIGKRNIQALQLVTRNSDETEDANKVRDFRMYRRLSGKNDPLPSANVDYSRADEKAFDKEKDPAAAERRAAGLAERARERRGTNTVEAIKDLRRAGQSRINFAPADYTERKAYFEYIERTQGKEAAAELEKAYQKALDMQRFKKSLPVRKFYEKP